MNCVYPWQHPPDCNCGERDTAAPREGHAVGWSEDAPAMSETERAREALDKDARAYVDSRIAQADLWRDRYAQMAMRADRAEKEAAALRAALGATAEPNVWMSAGDWRRVQQQAKRAANGGGKALMVAVQVHPDLVYDDSVPLVRSPSLPVAPSEEQRKPLRPIEGDDSDPSDWSADDPTVFGERP